MTDTLVKVENLSKKFCRSLKKSLWYGMKDLGSELIGRSHGGNGELRPDEFWALKDVSFELKRGECLGLIGRNGAGKSTLLRMLNGLIKPDKGSIEMRGRVGALIALGAGFNPILTGRENIYVNAAILGVSNKNLNSKIQEIIEFTEIGEFIDMPVQSYSSGMVVRLGFAVASALNPDVLVLDEVLAVGDASFRVKCFDRIGKILSTAAVVFVSHNEAQIRRICDQAILLDQGIMKYSGAPDIALSKYKMPLYVNNNSTESDWIKNQDVTHIQASIKSRKINWGDSLIIEIKLSSKRKIKISKSYIQFFMDDQSIAHAENNWESGSELVIYPGENMFKIKISSIHLVKGVYMASLAFFANYGKITIAHSRNIGSFEIIGSLGIGPKVLLPSIWQGFQ